MDASEFERVLRAGEGTTVEFKRCGAQAEKDTFETICSFANHSGGHIFLGVEDDGSVSGVSEPATLDIQRNISNTLNNPNVFFPPVAVEFEAFEYEGKRVVRVWVPVDAFVHAYKSVIYDRSVDTDVALRLDAQISALYLRKQATYTEQRIFPYVEPDDLELDLLDDARDLAERKRPGHPWARMGDKELLKSAGLHTKNYATGEEGYNLAAVLLLGRDEVISSILPAYKTDAVYRSASADRYDDRETVKCNLLRAYRILRDFCSKHINDVFYLEEGESVSARDILVRELLSNTLIHREYSSAFPAKVLITKDEIVTENGSKAAHDGPLDLSAFNPMPKNPLIASFFNAVGWADELGSGSRNLLKYARAFSDEKPELVEGNVFRARVALTRKTAGVLVDPEVSVLVTRLINEKGFVTTVDVRDGLHIEHKAAQRELAKLVSTGALAPIGNTRARRYVPVVGS